MALVALSLGACDGTPVVYLDEDGWVVTANAPSVDTGEDLPPAIDPRLDGFTAVSLRFPTRSATGATCTVELARDGTSLGVLDASVVDGACAADWSGADSTGAPLAPGPVDVTATVTRNGQSDSATGRIEVVHLGLREVQLGGDGREALLYSRMGGTRYGYYEMPVDFVPWRKATLEEASPEIHYLLESPPADVGSPGASHSLPTAWVAGSTPDVTPTFATEVDPAEVEVRAIAPDGLSLLDEGIVTDGASATFESTASPVPAVGVYDVSYEWKFEARVPGGEWIPLEGHILTEHRFYGLVDSPIFDYTSVPHRAWVDVVHLVGSWVDGTASDPVGVGSAIVDGVFYDLGLMYDRERGASHYTDYPGRWEGASFELSRFLERADGSTINCSDAASIVSTFANMVGIDLRYHIIQHDFLDRFLLNYLHAIGWDFAASPFTSGRNAFRYHAVVGPPDTTIFDATLALDGDGTPAAPPHELLLVQGLTQMDYLVGLSPEWDSVRVFVDEKVNVR